MKKASRILFYFGLLLLHSGQIHSQTFVTRSIKSFGAKGDGKTNDTKAFEDASVFFNSRAGNGKLVIPAGTYIVGRKLSPKSRIDRIAFDGEKIIRFISCKNVTIEGQKNSVIKYANGLKFGSFDPETGKIFENNNPLTLDATYGRSIGQCIFIEKCTNFTISGVTLNGNNKAIEYGGTYGDRGIQLVHYGIYISNSRLIRINNVNSGYFALDGIVVRNQESPSPDSIFISNSKFEYNNRQGLSWVGGNFLEVKNCDFNHTGQNGKNSAPGCGLDIEAEDGPVHFGRFYNCRFINNIGLGLGAENGNSFDCSFSGCTFWGTDYYAVLVKRPSFTFLNCRFYGTTVAGYDAVNSTDATKFIRCYFEDKPYNQVYKGKAVYIFDSDGARGMIVDSCTFVANKIRLAWMTNNGTIASQQRIVSNTHFIVKHASLVPTDVFLLLRGGVKFKNNVMEFTDPAARNKSYWPNACCIADINDLGGNKVIFH